MDCLDFDHPIPPFIGAAVILVIGLVGARLLRHRRSGPHLVEGR
jgi:hypothetical protein